VFGAPWMDPGSVDVSVPGFDLVATGFTPRDSAASLHPKWVDEDCRGLRIRVTDESVAEPYRLGVTLVQALAAQPEFDWRQNGEVLSRLLGTNAVFEALQAGQSADAIVEADRADHEAWRAARRTALLY